LLESRCAERFIRLPLAMPKSLFDWALFTAIAYLLVWAMATYI